MSTEAMEKFRAQLAEDEALQAELRTSAGVGSDDTLSTGALIDFAAAKGYEFTVEEVRASDMGLSDAELEGVAGGAADFFLKLDTIPGESKDAGHAGWTDILSFSQVLRFGG